MSSVTSLSIGNRTRILTILFKDEEPTLEKINQAKAICNSIQTASFKLESFSKRGKELRITFSFRDERCQDRFLYLIAQLITLFRQATVLQTTHGAPNRWKMRFNELYNISDLVNGYLRPRKGTKLPRLPGHKLYSQH